MTISEQQIKQFLQEHNYIEIKKLLTVKAEVVKAAEHLY